MKKIISISLIISALSLCSNTLSAQAFQKGNKNIDVGLGFGAYSTTATWNFGVLTVSNTDGAASFMMPISFEYGISDKFGLGAQIGFSNYFIDNEDSTETLASVKSIDFAIKLNYHLLNAEKNDLFVGLGIGASNLTWKDEDGTTLKGTGSFVSIYLTDRIFFSEHIGLLFNLGYTVFNYSKISESNGNVSIKWTFRGVNLGTGLAIKF
jgi:Outer membrane protein beta-barrel domain